MINHHPSDETLARLAAGTLEAGPALVVQTHISTCRQCEAGVLKFEAVGGALLEDLQPEPMKTDAFQIALARIETFPEPPATVTIPAARRSEPANGPIQLPASLQNCEIGKWRWLAPGIRRSRVGLPGSPNADVALYRIGANRSLIEHGHVGIEYTHVLSGSFSVGHNQYFPGDLVEADSAVEHQPRVGPEGECICLAAVQGQMRLRGMFAWLAQPFV